mmetsp:Transcript_8505/g.22224  ORF Transcript_8505/g.22224 Transcript_8505/m.22224 type:complete len:169 (+) Transcript_8505:421-927(+)
MVVFAPSLVKHHASPTKLDGSAAWSLRLPLLLQACIALCWASKRQRMATPHPCPCPCHMHARSSSKGGCPATSSSSGNTAARRAAVLPHLLPHTSVPMASPAPNTYCHHHLFTFHGPAGVGKRPGNLRLISCVVGARACSWCAPIWLALAHGAHTTLYPASDTLAVLR